jgi:hypothetical protein
MTTPKPKKKMDKNSSPDQLSGLPLFFYYFIMHNTGCVEFEWYQIQEGG